jgi:hypothetical protein
MNLGGGSVPSNISLITNNVVLSLRTWIETYWVRCFCVVPMVLEHDYIPHAYNPHTYHIHTKLWGLNFVTHCPTPLLGRLVYENWPHVPGLQTLSLSSDRQWYRQSHGCHGRTMMHNVFILTDKSKTRRGGGRRCRCYERQRPKGW